MASEINPYASPAAAHEPLVSKASTEIAQAEQIRREHIGHEASVKSIGWLYLIAGLITTGGVYFMIERGQLGIETAFVGAISMLMFATMLGLFRLHKWASLVAALFSAISLVTLSIRLTLVLLGGAPILALLPGSIGPLVNLYILWALFSKKAWVVFSPEYKQIIKATPHIKYKTSILIWILLGLVGVLILLGIIAAVVSQLSR